ncbi:uncharacterized protein LOC127876300 [Dreissena polymorpha]|uniref:uncharacterized protein LOC127876300 n=1 Tax=Dreissena polymorpha TaxID=45954 RepID=UPI00226420DF|nr:uncharacterized protein LOC127876300 [Dreissena polymorpha]
MTIACLMLIVGSVCINASHDKKTADAMDELQARVGARPFFNRAERYSQFQLARTKRWVFLCIILFVLVQMFVYRQSKTNTVILDCLQEGKDDNVTAYNYFAHCSEISEKKGTTEL